MAPRLHYINGNSYPVQFERGDVVFIAGSPPSDKPIPWEHVAIVAEPCMATCDEDVTHLKTLGLPESRNRDENKNHLPGLAIVTIGPCYARNWAGNAGEWANLSDPCRCWNLGAKPFGDNVKESTHCMDALAILTGLTIFEYRNDHEAFPPILSGTILNTNCIGFVSWALRLNRLILVVDDFGFSYPSPYTDGGSRTRPSAGHLAYALTGAITTLPYQPKGQQEAVLKAKAVTTIEEWQ